MKKLLILTLLLSGCSVGSYQGRTAEEWHQAYVDESYERVDFYNQLMELEDTLDGLKECVDGANVLEEAQNCTYYY